VGGFLWRGWVFDGDGFLMGMYRDCVVASRSDCGVGGDGDGHHPSANPNTL